jgi:L-cysteine:1D-myo-inositol 2-amino-2-deoxy-alpha-D-glucopyranoside ligase
MQLFNVLTGRLEQFETSGDRVSLYVCGITPYDTTHLGHVFTYATFDVLIRYIEFLGGKVRYAQNVTDIDDDILRRASEVGEEWQKLGDRWTVHFIDDNVALNIRPPDHFPRATDVIDGIVDTVQDLLAAGVAYESAGNIYFNLDRDPEYGKLSRLSYDEMLPVANERGNNPDDPNKRDPLDFVLWQGQGPGEPAWDSPWGPGRPGWHIECSTMSTSYLGQPIDIHGGGADLIFPHHESEIAQAENASGHQPYTRFWMHVSMVRYQGEKMSKSLGNLVMVRDLLETGWSADAIRMVMVGRHYRKPWSYEESGLAKAAEIAEKLKAAVTVAGGDGQLLDSTDAEEAFTTAMDNDLDTPTACNVLEGLAESILSAAARGQDVRAAQKVLRDRCTIFGLTLDHAGPQAGVVAGWAIHRRRFMSEIDRQTSQ